MNPINEAIKQIDLQNEINEIDKTTENIDDLLVDKSKLKRGIDKTYKLLVRKQK